MDTPIVATLIVASASFLAVCGMFVVRRLYPPEKLERLHDAAGNMLAVVGTMYALLVALIVVDAMTNMQEARATTEMEANSLADIFRLAEGMEDKHRVAIQQQAYKYGRSVVDDEWTKMGSATESEQAWSDFSQLWKVIEDVEPQTEKQKTFYAQIVAELSSLGDNRRSRLLACHHGISALLWWVLVAGAAVTISFTYFFKVESWRLQAAMIVMVTVTISLNLFLIAEYGFPFQGSLSVQPDAFMEDLNRFSKSFGAESLYQTSRRKH